MSSPLEGESGQVSLLANSLRREGSGGGEAPAAASAELSSNLDNAIANPPPVLAPIFDPDVEEGVTVLSESRHLGRVNVSRLVKG
jgi:hypothetical protein